MLRDILGSVIAQFGPNSPRQDQQFGEALAWEVHCHSGKEFVGLTISDLEGEGVCKGVSAVLEAFEKRSLELGSTTSTLYRQAVSSRLSKKLTKVKSDTLQELNHWRDIYAAKGEYDENKNPLDAVHTKLWYEIKISVLEAQVLDLEGLLESLEVSVDNVVAYTDATRRLADDYTGQVDWKNFREALYTHTTVLETIPLALTLSETSIRAETWERLATALEKALGIPA